MPRKAAKPAPKKKFVSRLSNVHVHQIVAALDALQPRARVTWKDVVILAKRATKSDFSRQALSKHDDIEQAYTRAVRRYREHRDGNTPKAPRPKTDAEVTVERQAERIAELERKINEYDEKLLRLLGNARKKGLSPEQLLVPLPLIPKGQTDTGAKGKKAKATR